MKNKGDGGMDRKRTILCFIVISFLFLGGSIYYDQSQRMPEDFAFSIIWGVESNTYYDSASGKLIKDRRAMNPEKYTTTYNMPHGEKEKIWKYIEAMPLDSYPSSYDPAPESQSAPSMNIELTVSYGDYKKVITCTNIAIILENECQDVMGRQFVDAYLAIQKIIGSSKEWRALPQFENIYV